MGRTWVAQHPHCMRCAYVTYTHSVYNAGTVKPIFIYTDMSHFPLSSPTYQYNISNAFDSATHFPPKSFCILNTIKMKYLTYDLICMVLHLLII